jgi:hypothetical protein
MKVKINFMILLSKNQRNRFPVNGGNNEIVISGLE